MWTIEDKLKYLETTKALIKEAIINKGVIINDNDTFRSYADKIKEINPIFKVPQGMIFSGSTMNEVPIIDTSNITDMSYMFESCTNITDMPILNCTNNTSLHRTFYNCEKLKRIPSLDTFYVESMDSAFSNCPALTRIEGLDFGSLVSNELMLKRTDNVVYFNVKNLGITPFITRYDFSNLSKWGDSSLETDARTSLLNTLQNNIFNRTENGMLEKVTIVLHPNVNKMLTTDLKNNLTAKGYIIEVAKI